ncbi:MAG: HEPN domain-containing protein [Anaerolineae bacterium]|nr:HEPN domain-containing protein [Anaerolineae bacterium]
MSEYEVSQPKRVVLSEARVPYLTGQERQIVERFLQRLAEIGSHRLRRVVLYGSKARGDAEPESDIDLLIVGDDLAEVVQRVQRALEEEDTAASYLQPLVLSDEAYREHRDLRLPLYVNIRREGVELWDEAAREWEERTTPLNFEEGKPMEQADVVKEIIILYWEKAERELENVRLLRDHQRWTRALSCAYYAAFYALTAALYSLGVVRSKHTGIRSALSQFLVAPGLVEEEYKDIYHLLFKARGCSDYEPRYKPLEAETLQLLGDAERFVQRMEKFLRDQGY